MSVFKQVKAKRCLGDVNDECPKFISGEEQNIALTSCDCGSAVESLEEISIARVVMIIAFALMGLAVAGVLFNSLFPMILSPSTTPTPSPTSTQPVAPPQKPSPTSTQPIAAPKNPSPASTQPIQDPPPTQPIQDPPPTQPIQDPPPTQPIQDPPPTQPIQDPPPTQPIQDPPPTQPIQDPPPTPVPCKNPTLCSKQDNNS